MKTQPIFCLIVSCAVAVNCSHEALADSGAAASPAAGAKPAASTKSAAQANVSVTPSPARPMAPPPVRKAATAAPAPPSPTKPNAAPAAVLRAARDKLTDLRIQSIKARIIERVSIDGRKFQTEGSYLQGTELRLRLELAVPTDSAARDGVEGSFLEVCDGTILWTQHRIGKNSRITRRNVRQILDASKSGGAPNVLAVELGLGGLPALLASLEHWMNFDAARQQSVKGKTFIVLSGTWNDAAHEKFKTKLHRTDLPPHVPDAVQIYFEPEILFPRRIAYLKHRGAGEEPEPLVVLDFLDIVINGPVDPHAFDFTPPGGLRTIDVTNTYLQQVTGAAAK